MLLKGNAGSTVVNLRDLQYCEFGGTAKKCEEWLKDNHPDLYGQLYSEGMKVRVLKDKRRRRKANSPWIVQKPSVPIYRTSRYPCASAQPRTPRKRKQRLHSPKHATPSGRLLPRYRSNGLNVTSESTSLSSQVWKCMGWRTRRWPRNSGRSLLPGLP